jgi:hypothetical protein
MSNWRFTHITPDDIEYPLNNERTVFYAGSQGLGLDTAEPMGVRVPYQHGVDPMGLYIGPKEIELALRIIADTRPEWAEADAQLARDVSALRHAQVGQDAPPLCTLRIQRPDGETRDIDVWLIGYPKDSGEVVKGLAGTRILRYWAPTPLFYDPEEVTQTLAVTGGEGALSFPLTFPITFPETTIDSDIYVNNDGEVPTWPAIRLNGPGQDPVLDNETLDKSLGLSQTMESGDYILIDMGEATITFHDDSEGTDESILESITAGSEFWPLNVGSNQVHVTMSQAYSGSVAVSYIRYFTTV